jgi:hypothetical protein
MLPGRCSVTVMGLRSRVTVHRPSAASSTIGASSAFSGNRQHAPPTTEGRGRDGQYQQARRAGGVGVHHLLPGLAGVHGLAGKGLRGAFRFVRRVGHADQVAVAARPVGATQPGVGQARALVSGGARVRQGRLPGCRVVADSVPELAWKETEAKARALIRVAELVEEEF